MHKFRVAAAACFALALVALPSTAAAQSSGWNPGPGAVLENTYDGFIDAPTSGSTVPGSGTFTVNGWFVDRTAQGWAGADDVQVFLGEMGAGGTLLARALFAQSRPDVGTALGNPFFAASGFVAVINGSQVPAGPQTLNVYVHTPGKGWWFKSVNVTGGGPASSGGTAAPAAPTTPATGSSEAPELSITHPSNEQEVSTKSSFTIRGNAVVAGAGAAGIARVEVYINGDRETGSFLGEATLNGDGTWELTFEPTRFSSMHSNLFVYAFSKTSNRVTEAVRGFNIVDR